MEVAGIIIYDPTRNMWPTLNQVGTVKYKHNIHAKAKTVEGKERVDDPDVYDPDRHSKCHYFLPLSDTVVAIVEIKYKLRPPVEYKVDILWRQLKEAFGREKLSKKSSELTEIFNNPFTDPATRKVEAKVDAVKTEAAQSMGALLNTRKSLDQLLEKSKDLEANAVQFKRQTKKMTPKNTWPQTLTTVGLFSTGFVTGTVGAAALLMGKITGLYIACCAGGYAVCFLMLAYGLYNLIRENMTPQNTMTTALRAASFR